MTVKAVLRSNRLQTSEKVSYFTTKSFFVFIVVPEEYVTTNMSQGTKVILNSAAYGKKILVTEERNVLEYSLNMI